MKRLFVSFLVLLCPLLNLLHGLDNKFINIIYQSKLPVANNIKVFDQYAYIYDDWHLYIYSLKNNWKPIVETGFVSSYPITDVEILDFNHIYVCSHEPSNYVTEMDSLNTFGHIYSVQRMTCDKARREGSLLFTSHRENGLEIYDISKGILPQKVTGFSDNWGIIDIETRYPIVHALNDFGYVNIDVLNIEKPEVNGTNYEILDGRFLSINRNIVWVAALSTLYALDITYPDKPVIVNRYRFSSEIYDLKAKDNELFVGLKSGGLKILNITNPKKISEKNSFFIKSTLNSIFIDGDYIYLGTGAQGWYILEYK